MMVCLARSVAVVVMDAVWGCCGMGVSLMPHSRQCSTVGGAGQIVDH